MSDDIIDLDLNLTYAHGIAELKPYFDALAEGRALARKCSACGRVWFPPHAACPIDGAGCDWTELEGTGVVVSATCTHARLPLADTAADHVFVLVAMDGAGNAAFGRLLPSRSADPVGHRVRIGKAGGDVMLPAQAAVFELIEET